MADMIDTPSARLLADLQDAYQIPALLVQELSRRGVLPSWVKQSAGMRNDWLQSLHAASTEKGWPEELKSVSAGLLASGGNLGFAQMTNVGATISIPISTPCYLRVLLNILGYSFVPPDSNDPEATMFLNGKRMDEAAIHLGKIIGMLAETGYVDAPSDEDSFGGAVTTGSRFLYYHELAHVALRTSSSSSCPEWIVPGEEYLADELAADQLAFTCLVLEFRNHPVLQPAAVSGVVLALGFLALKEFAEREYEGGKRRTKNATLRMHRVFYWAQLSKQMGGLTEEAIAVGKNFWDVLRGLLVRIQRIPSPIFSLLLQTAERPEEDWQTASNHLVCWCAFGSRGQTLQTVRNIRDSAQNKVSQEPRAQNVLRLIEFLRNDTDDLEPTLGLQAALDLK